MKNCKIKLLIFFISLMLAVVACSNEGSYDVGPEAEKSNLNVTVSTPQSNNEASIESVFNEIEVDSIKTTVKNTEDADEVYQKQKEIEDDTAVFEFNDLVVKNDYQVEVDAFEADNNKEVLVYQGESEAAIDEQVSTVTIDLELFEAKGLIIELSEDDFAGLTVEEINLLPESNNLSAGINDLRAEFEQLESNYYSLAVDLDNNEELARDDLYVYGDQITVAELSYSDSEGLETETSWQDSVDVADFNLTTDMQEYRIEEEIELEVKNTSEQELEFADSSLGLEVERKVDGSWQEYDLDLQASDGIVSLAAGESELLNLAKDDLEEVGSYNFEIIAWTADKEEEISRNTEIEIIEDNEAIAPEDRIEEFHNLRIYQVMTSSFQSGDNNLGYGTGYGPSDHMGDLIGIKEAIPYIADLGMNAIWMTPVFETYGDDQLASTGYFANDFFSIDPEFGTEEDMRNLIEKAQDYDLYVFFDGVFGHHNDTGEIPESPSGHTPSGPNDPVDYPESLDFFEEVATYWIEEYEIDGWRLDQAYQPTDYQGKQDRNYWPDIRESVEEAAKETDTLGYMVGEIWDGEDVINDYGYETETGDKALYSNYEFPLRYRLVQTLATQEHTDQENAYDRSAEALDEGYEAYEETYPDHAIPNLMLTNHDLVRFGTLIQRAPHLDYGKENPDYWSRHEAAISFLAAHTGPITLYYGDEIGDDIPGYVDERDGGYWDDHASRTDGQIDGFDNDQQDLRDYVQELMELRDNNPALWRGERVNLIAENNQYADLKVDEETGEEMLYLLNIGTDRESFTIDSSDLRGENLTNVLTGDEIDVSGSEIEIDVAGLSAKFIEIN